MCNTSAVPTEAKESVGFLGAGVIGVRGVRGIMWIQETKPRSSARPVSDPNF